MLYESISGRSALVVMGGWPFLLSTRSSMRLHNVAIFLTFMKKSPSHKSSIDIQGGPERSRTKGCGIQNINKKSFEKHVP